ncbi:MAG TPA: MarR family transcriptional regulator [Gaiellaceae bacterium]|nr:MarR family transcriptional regulator [Gaiellaceae bacterium]
MKPPKTLDPVGRQLVFTAKSMREAFEDMLAAEGATLPGWVVLSGLADMGCVTQGALASHAHLEGATITHHVDKLEAAGLVRRQLDPLDRRVRRLELTEAGTELHRRLLGAVIAMQRRVLAGIDPADMAVLARCLETIQANLASGPSS